MKSELNERKNKNVPKQLTNTTQWNVLVRLKIVLHFPVDGILYQTDANFHKLVARLFFIRVTIDNCIEMLSSRFSSRHKRSLQTDSNICWALKGGWPIYLYLRSTSYVVVEATPATALDILSSTDIVMFQNCITAQISKVSRFLG